MNVAGIVTVDKDEVEEAYKCLYKTENSAIEEATKLDILAVQAATWRTRSRFTYVPW